MIHGNGFIGRLLKSQLGPEATEGVEVYCRGVSNTYRAQQSDFERDLSELEAALKTAKHPIVYISSSDLSYKGGALSKYLTHKKQCEEIVLEATDAFILRVPQVLGNLKSRYSLINYLIEAIKNRKSFELYSKRKRFPTRPAEFTNAIVKIILKCKIQGVMSRVYDASPMYGMYARDIVSMIEQRYGLLGAYVEIEDSCSSERDNSVNLWQWISELRQPDYCYNALECYLDEYDRSFPLDR